MRLFNILRTSAKRKKVLILCEMLIKKYENTRTPSCKDELLNHIDEGLKDLAKDIVLWDDSTNYEEIAHSLIISTTEGMLSSGRYNIYTGVINPMKCGHNLLHCYEKSLKWGLDNGYYDEEVYDSQRQELMRCISAVG